VICEQILPVPLTQCVVPDAERTAAQMAQQFLQHPAEAMLTVGVVGGAGKTTTALLTAAVLRGAGQRCAYETDLGASDGIVQTVPESRPRDGLELLQWLAEARDAGAAAAVIELDGALLSRASLRSLSLDVVIVTGEVTGERGEALQRTLDLALERLGEGGVAVVNADSTAAVSAADRAAVATLSYAVRRAAQLEAKIFDQQPGETTLMVTAGDVTATLQTPLTGPAMASCQLAALTVGMLVELPLHEAIAALEPVRQIPGRMQRLGRFGAPSVVLDSGGDSRRLRAVLRGLRRERGSGRLWVVASLPQGGDEVDLAASGRVAEKYADRVVVTAGMGAKAGFLAAAHGWLDGVERTAEPRLIADREAALQWVLREACADDTVLVAGGWPSDAGPAVQRAALECEVELIGSLQAQVERPARREAAEPVILPHPALK
jgi:UDP-N-acetylmuramoyl-L-alanyl-D-glutamate--2,6-diaminopimelate ligase